MRWNRSYFFNEPLKKQVLDLICDDVKHCDLVFVIGINAVDPFASIPNLLDKNIPLILINREIVGSTQYQFDVNILGNCDDICENLIYELKWNYDYSKIIEPHPYKFIAPNHCLFKDGKAPQISSTQQITKQATNLINVDNKMQTIVEDEEDENDEEKEASKDMYNHEMTLNLDNQLNIGDTVRYQCKNSNKQQTNSSANWNEGQGIIQDIFDDNNETMIK